MPEVRRNPTSGTFVRPMWRRALRRYELALALGLEAVFLAGFFFLTVRVGDLYGLFCEATGRPWLEDAKVTSVGGAPQRSAGRLALAALTATAEPVSPRTAGSAPAPAEPGMLERFRVGRQLMNGGLLYTSSVLQTKAPQANWKWWTAAAVGLLLGALFCFGAWPLRRAGTALLGAVVFGFVGFLKASDYGMGTTGALVVAVAPAFVGALLGWHLLVLFTTVLAGGMLGGAVANLVQTTFDIPAWMPPAIVLMVICSLGTALVYLLASRSAMIGAWAAFGASALSAAVTLSLGSLSAELPLWDLFLAVFVVLAIAGCATQYRFVCRLAQEPPEPLEHRRPAGAAEPA